ncbi:MAG TPA: rod shape-determining protein MreC, partial [Dehalococcoidia bacterium]|nr:rod shape-determining protein MreC [Dehalococcoidia bacterium]
SHIPAIVQDTRFDGILSGHQDGGMRLEMLPNAASVEAGDTIVTSGLNGELPKGLPLGRVIEVGGSDQDPFPSVFVEPLTALDRLEHLVVLTSFRPGGIPDAESVEEAAPEQGALAAADAPQTEEATAQAGQGAEQRPDESRLPGSGQ